MTRIIAVSVFKGGCGKTSTAVNLSAALSMRDKNVLLIDCDTQGQAGQALGVQPEYGLVDLVQGTITASQALVEARPNLYLLGGGPTLAGLKNEISRAEFGGEKTIATAIAPLVDFFDYIIFDTGPGYDAISINVLFAAHEVISPINLEVLSIQGLMMFTKQLARIQKHHDIELKYVVPNALDRRIAQTKELLNQLQGHFNGLLCDPIRYSVRVSEAPGHQQHIFEYDPHGKAAKDYTKLLERILQDES